MERRNLSFKLNLWDSVYSSDNSFFGNEPSILAKQSLRFLDEHGCKNILELGCGQGRDAIFFARNGYNVHAIDSSNIALSQTRENIAKLGLGRMVRTSQANLSKELPEISEEEKVNAVFSNLFYCMPFSDGELRRIFGFVHDLLPQGGLHIFSFRDKQRDAAFSQGKEISKDTFEINGFRIRFFSKDEMLALNSRFKTLQISEAFEEPCFLLLVFSSR